MPDVASRERTNTTELGRRLAGKYLTFMLGEEEYGVQILKVQEIIRMQRITRVPRSPEFVRGVINLRGRVIPVVELRTKFGMEHHEDTDRTCIIVVQFGDAQQCVTMGVLIDEVKEVTDIGADAIDPPPEFGASVDTAFILGIGKLGEDVKILLDVERVLAFDELEAVRDAAEPDEPGDHEDADEWEPEDEERIEEEYGETVGEAVDEQDDEEGESIDAEDAPRDDASGGSDEETALRQADGDADDEQSGDIEENSTPERDG